MNLLNEILVAGNLLGEADTTILEKQNTDDFSKNSIEIFEGPNTKFQRLNLFYILPLKTDTYTFVDFNDDGFYVKTTTHTPINNQGTGIRSKIKHSNQFNDQINIGLEQKFSYENLNTLLRVLPLGFNRNGRIKDHFLLSYSISKTVPKINLKIGSFGEMNLKNKKGVSWNYGEVYADFNLPTKYGKFIVGGGYNFNKLKDRNFFDPQFRVKIGYHPKK
jgi:hypothetical protein